MAKRYKRDHSDTVDDVKNIVTTVVNAMNNVFINQDNLLRTQGIMVVYYLLFKRAIENSISITRYQLENFEQSVKNNRRIAEENYENADYDLLEYDRLSQYGTNDVSNIRERYRILSERISFNVPIGL